MSEQILNKPLDLDRIKAPSAENFPIEEDQEIDAPKGAKYEERIVAFVDILGFKEIINRSENDNDLVYRIHEALSLSQDYTADEFIKKLDLKCQVDSFDDRRHTFSDFIVMSVGPSIEELGLLVYVIFQKYRDLLGAGFTCRGGIAKGQLLHKQNGNHHAAPQMIFGPAFVEAYHLESVHAEAPRVILQRTVWKMIEEYCIKNSEKKLSDFLKTHVKRSDDGPAYIDIFADFNINEFYTEQMDIDKEVSRIKDYICKALDESNDRPKIFKKNAYLAKLFNRAVNGSNLSCNKIPSDKLPI